MKKIADKIARLPKLAVAGLGLTFALIFFLGYGLYYEKYLKPVNCRSYDIDHCPNRCAICPSCKNCADLACQDIKTCKDLGLYFSWFEQFRSNQADKPLDDIIRENYEPALKQAEEYDHFEVVECGETLCVKIYLKRDSESLRARMPKMLERMRVIYEIIGESGGKSGPACEIENCHGMEIVCGPDPAEVCTQVYMLGDGCRKFAACGIVDGKCQPVPLDGFEKCKACVEKCAADFKDDSVKMFECESLCTKEGS